MQGCAGVLAFIAVCTAVNHALMTPRVPAGLRFWAALSAAVPLGLGLSTFWSLARGFRGGGSYGDVLRRARTGEAPADGQAIVATGLVRPLATPLTAPISHTPCAGYLYRMFSSREGTREGEVSFYWGYAAQPFALDGPSTRVRVLAVPLLMKCPAAIHRGPDAVARARAFVRATTFEPAAAGMRGELSAFLQQMRETFTDDDGVSRRDWKREGDARDPEGLVLEETLLRVEVEASVHGPWSSARGGIVAPGAFPAGTAVNVVLGRPEKHLRDLGVLPSTRSYVVTAMLTTALGIALVWFALDVLPTLAP